MHTLQEQAYLFGRQLAFEKAATSRWREAIRSGELSPSQSEILKDRMGVTPAAWSEKLTRGAQLQAEHLNLPFNTHTPGSIVKGYLQGIRKKDPELLQRSVAGLQTYGMGGGSGNAVGGINLTNMPLEIGMPATEIFNAPMKKEIRALKAGHEGREIGQETRRFHLRPKKVTSTEGKAIEATAPKPQRIREGLMTLRDPKKAIQTQGSQLSGSRRGIQNLFRSMGTKQKDVDFMWKHVAQPKTLQQSGLLSGNHSSAHPLLWDIRESRMLSPETRLAWEKFRDQTGELERVRAAAGQQGTRGPVHLPRKQLGNIRKGVGQQAAREIQQLFSQPATGWGALMEKGLTGMGAGAVKMKELVGLARKFRK